MAEVAVLGTGRMGSAMALRLAAAGHAVQVWNRSVEAAHRLSMRDGRIAVARTAAEAVAEVSVVLSVLADGNATRAVLLDATVLDALEPGTVVVDMATSGVETARALDGVLTAAGARFVDGPVSGSVPAVESGTLLVMAAGDADAISAALPVLSTLGDRVVTVGPAGSGQVMKLAVNLVVHDLNAAVAEALQLAESGGLERHGVYDVLEQSVVAAPFVQYKRRAFLDQDTPVAMSIALVLKDLQLICEQAAAAAVHLPVTERARDRAAAAVAAGMGSLDMADLSRWSAPD